MMIMRKQKYPMKCNKIYKYPPFTLSFDTHECERNLDNLTQMRFMYGC